MDWIYDIGDSLGFDFSLFVVFVLQQYLIYTSKLIVIFYYYFGEHITTLLYYLDYYFWPFLFYSIDLIFDINSYFYWGHIFCFLLGILLAKLVEDKIKQKNGMGI